MAAVGLPPGAGNPDASNSGLPGDPGSASVKYGDPAGMDRAVSLPGGLPGPVRGWREGSVASLDYFSRADAPSAVRSRMRPKACLIFGPRLSIPAGRNRMDAIRMAP